MSLQRDIRKYYVFRVTIKRVVLPILAVRMLAVGVTPAEVALIAAVGQAWSVFLEVPSGAVADNLGHRRALVISLLGQAVAMMLYFGNSFWWMLVATSVYYIAGSLMTGTHQALLYERLEEEGRVEDHQRISGRAYAIANAFGIVALPIAGGLYAVQWWIPFLAGIAQFCIGAVAMSRFGTASRRYNTRPSQGVLSSYRNIGAAVRMMRHEPLQLSMIIMTGLIIGTSVAITELHQVLLQNVGFAVALFGVFYAAKRLIGSILSYFLEDLIRLIPPMTLFFLGALFLFVQLFGVILTDSITVTILLLILTAVPLSVNGLVTNHYQNVIITSENRATILSFTGLVQSLVTMLVAVGISAVAAVWSVEGAYLVVGCIVTPLAIALYIPMHRQFRLYTQTEPTI